MIPDRRKNLAVSFPGKEGITVYIPVGKEYILDWLEVKAEEAGRPASEVLRRYLAEVLEVEITHLLEKLDLMATENGSTVPIIISRVLCQHVKAGIQC